MMARDTETSRSSPRARRVAAGLAASVLVGAFAYVGPTAVAAAPGAPPSARATPAVASPGETRRVDLETPTFSDPTNITNPLFPISKLRQVIQLGAEGDVALRHDITLLPGTKTIRWNGKKVETLVSQFVAYGDGRVLEIAVDFFAQADDGSVWYFGEDVANYEDGVIVNHDGTWRAGRDGPPGMIMPAHPRVGDVYRPENIPGFVFEEVTVKAVNQTVAGPRGPVRGAIVVKERLMDGVLEDKIFAPGYGEFLASVPTEDELVTVAVADPTDDLRGTLPDELTTLSKGAAKVFEAAPDREWSELRATLGRMTAAWSSYRTGDPPALLDTQMSEALDGLDAAIGARNVAEVRQAAIDVAQANLDLRLQYQSPDRVDRSRTKVWRRQIVADRAAGDSAGVAGDRAVLDAIDDRFDDDDDD